MLSSGLSRVGSLMWVFGVCLLRSLVSFLCVVWIWVRLFGLMVIECVCLSSVGF